MVTLKPSPAILVCISNDNLVPTGGEVGKLPLAPEISPGVSIGALQEISHSDTQGRQESSHVVAHLEATSSTVPSKGLCQ